jgi:hypothetical protein
VVLQSWKTVAVHVWCRKLAWNLKQDVRYELLKQNLDSLSYNYLQIHVIKWYYLCVIVELLKPKVDCPSKWCISLEKAQHYYPDSLNIVLKHIEGKSSTKTVAVDVNVSFVKVDGSASPSRSEI